MCGGRGEVLCVHVYVCGGGERCGGRGRGVCVHVCGEDVLLQ